jgi:hypothetical protein
MRSTRTARNLELKRRLYTRGSSYETTIPKPLLFSVDLKRRQLVRFIYDEEKARWYVDFEQVGEETAKDEDQSTGEKG